MLKKLVTTIASLGVAFAANLFAEEVFITPLQVAPSTINLEANGVTVVTIQTLLKYRECIDVIYDEAGQVVGKNTDLMIDLQVYNEDSEMELEDEVISYEYTFENEDDEAICDSEVDDLCFTDDRLGHVVIRIVGWDRKKDEIQPGDASFALSGTCNIGGEEVEVSGMDDALIIAK